jgi:uncharacterized protein Yka (UPF0111/DUF47 family)
MNFISRLMPREGRFFSLFDGHAKLVVDGALALADVLKQYDTQKDRETGIKVIEDAEHAADRITHETVQLLHTTFVTPFDRDDIHRLISRMDDVLDLIQDTGESLVLYDIQRVTPEAIQLAELLRRCAEHVQSAVGLMASMARSRICSATSRTCARSSSSRPCTRRSRRPRTSARTWPT